VKVNSEVADWLSDEQSKVRTAARFVVLAAGALCGAAAAGA